MRKMLLLASLILVPVLAAAQDGRSLTAGLEPTGTILLESLPARADLVVHTSDLPALLESGARAGLGGAEAWKRSFAEQLGRWGRLGDAKKLTKGGQDLLALADGEVLLAGMKLPGRRGNERVFVFALRTRADSLRIRQALQRVVDGGLKEHYVGAARGEEIQGRPVLALKGTSRSLWVHADDGLLVAADHPLALGLLLKGLEKTVAGGATGGKAKRLLEVRYGSGDDRWLAWTEDGKEWLRPPAGPSEPAPDDASLGSLLAIPYGAEKQQPLLPARLPGWARAVSGFLPRDVEKSRGTLAVMPDGSLAVVLDAALPQKDRERILAAVRSRDPRARLGERGGRLVLSTRPAAPGEPEAGATTMGTAVRGGWLRAMAAGRWPPPCRGLSRTLVPTPAGKDGAQERLAWTREKVFVSGPVWHGPATFLGLRAIHDVCHGRSPTDAVAAEEAPVEVDKGKWAPLPPPVAPRPAEDR